MSRSKRKINIIPVCSSSMKDWKKNASKMIRRMAVDEEMLHNGQYKKLSDVWMSPSDGKYFSRNEKDLRK